MLCDNLVGRDEVGSGKEVQEGGDMCIIRAHSRCSMAQTNTTFYFIYLCAMFFFPFIFISWRLITLQYCSGFCHTLT